MISRLCTNAVSWCPLPGQKPVKKEVHSWTLGRFVLVSDDHGFFSTILRRTDHRFTGFSLMSIDSF